MEANYYYAERFKTRYKLDVSLWKAFMNFLGFYPHLYDEAVKHIAEKTTREALMSDISAIRQDGYKIVCEQELQDIKKARLKYTVEQE